MVRESLRAVSAARRVVAPHGVAAAVAAVLWLAATGALCAGEAAADGLIASPEAGWPQWRGPRRDGISNETGLLASWPEGGPKRLWKIDDLGRGWSSPIIVNGTVYVTGDVGKDLVIYAFDLGGRPKWKVTNGRAWTRSFPGSRACCAYSEGVLYHMNAHGRVAALDASTGKQRWAVEVLERFGSRNITWAMGECLLVDGPRLIVTPAGPKTLMAALDKTDGRTVWTCEPVPDEMASYCSPILFRHSGRRFLTNCTSHHAFGVDADTGKLLWTVPLRNRHGVTITTPVYGGGCVFYVTPDGPNGVCYRIGGDPPGTHVALVWRSPVDTLTGGAVLVDGLLFANGCKKSKTLHAIDWTSGRTRYELPRFTSERPRWGGGACVWADGRLYCLIEDGRVALLEPKPDGFAVAGRFQLVDAKRADAWAHPVLLDGRLYLRYDETLWCYDVRGR